MRPRAPTAHAAGRATRRSATRPSTTRSTCATPSARGISDHRRCADLEAAANRALAEDPRAPTPSPPRSRSPPACSPRRRGRRPAADGPFSFVVDGGPAHRRRGGDLMSTIPSLDELLTVARPGDVCCTQEVIPELQTRKVRVTDWARRRASTAAFAYVAAKMRRADRLSARRRSPPPASRTTSSASRRCRRRSPPPLGERRHRVGAGHRAQPVRPPSQIAATYTIRSDPAHQLDDARCTARSRRAPSSCSSRRATATCSTPRETGAITIPASGSVTARASAASSRQQHRRRHQPTTATRRARPSAWSPPTSPA
jgi:hypothetical protein